MKLDPDILVMLDGDGQHDPGEIPMLMEPILASEADMVVCSTYVEGASMDSARWLQICCARTGSQRKITPAYIDSIRVSTRWKKSLLKVDFGLFN